MKTLPLFYGLREKLADFFYPRDCFFCNAPISRPGRMVCDECRNTLFPAYRSVCSICAAEMQHMLAGSFICSNCRNNPPAYAKAAVGVPFEGYVRALLIYYKYIHGFWLRYDLVDLLEPVCREDFAEETIDFAIPVPMSRRKERKRGYNQAVYIARELARRLEIPCRERILSRVDAIQTQTRMTAAERRSHAAQTFRLRVAPEKIKGKTILLVDDIMTTGATFNTCATLLLKAGAARVLAAAIARTRPK